ncbi:LOW QUALITY PROTEIN: cytochrome P450 3A19-like [Meriones unguiculatus]|uniref:LOW QUALITY PROTEIN: cytochrome P450 3A19-like n=1 Tax=Meriones unguiculatus TaxID=10047 RepID=UPI00293E700D|nr:LOW QUALITY PROTEIN: cytochrome P450 3A19-like [Meriones unguiculatus]
MLGYFRGVWKYDMECFEKYGTMWGQLDGQVPSLVVMDREFIRSVMYLGPAGPWRNGLTIAKDEAWRRLRALLSPTFTGRAPARDVPHHRTLRRRPGGAPGPGGGARRARVSAASSSRSWSPCSTSSTCPCSPRDAVDFFRAFLERAKEQHREPGRENRVDFLQLMLNAQEHAEPGKALTDSDILAQSIFFIFAGYDTTSSTLAFMLHALATRPHVQARLQAAVDAALPGGVSPPTYQSLEALDYVDMVVSETLRLYPVCSRVDRVCGRDVTLHGVSLPRGAVVTVPVYALHHDPGRWAEPEDFRPERFSPEHRAAIDPYSYLPFGCGPRNCIGRRFALMTMKLALTKLVQRFSFLPCEETRIPLQLGLEPNLHPAKPIVLRVVSREV